MIITPIKTRILVPPKDDLLAAIKGSLKTLKEKSIVVVTSKVESIWQGRCVPITQYKNKDKLVIKEADAYLPRKLAPNGWCIHTLKNNLFIPSAGIDESNGKGHYILWPESPKAAVRKLYQWFRKQYRIKDLGVIISDSHTIPLRRGVLGISLAHWGFTPLKDYRQKPDLFGRRLTMTQTNIADGLGAAAVLVMGEGREATPLAVIQDVGWIKFVPRPLRSKKPFSSFEIKTKEDLYYPLLKGVHWRRGGQGQG